MAADDRYAPNKIPWWIRNTRTTATPQEARQRLDDILSNKLLWFNPYRASDRQLLDCAERGRWLTFPSLTQMLVYHFSDIRPITGSSEGLFFRIGNTDEELHLGIYSLTHPITHIVMKNPMWTLINGRHLVGSSIHTLEGKDCFISHALNGIRTSGAYGSVFRMNLLTGSETKRAATVRESMCEAKISMLNEVLRYPIHPDYLGNMCDTFDYRDPILRAIDAIRQFPSSTPPTVHVIG